MFFIRLGRYGLINFRAVGEQFHHLAHTLIHKCRHIRRERVSSAMDGELKSIHGAWFPAIHAGMTILEGAMMKSDKVELSSEFNNDG